MARGKGEGTVYKDAEGRWRAAVPLPPDPVTGRRRRKVVRGRTRAEAVRRMRQVQLEVARTGDVPTGRTLTVAGWLERWLEQDVAPVRKPSTTGDYRSAVRVHIVPAIGRRRLDRLTPDDVRAVHRAVLGGGASTTTAAKVHRVLRAALGAAEREGLVPRNVARLVRSPPVSSTPPRSMTAEEAGRFLEARRRRGDYARWATSLLLGARQGEVLGITLDGLHLDAGAPWVELAWEVRRVTWAHGCAAARPQDGAWPCGRRRGADCPSRHAPVPAHLEAERVHGGLWLLRRLRQDALLAHGHPPLPRGPHGPGTPPVLPVVHRPGHRLPDPRVPAAPGRSRRRSLQDHPQMTYGAREGARTTRCGPRPVAARSRPLRRQLLGRSFPVPAR